LGEIDQDFKFLSRLRTDEIECPTCGNHYLNDFAARFAIASDEDKVAEFVAHLTAEIQRLDAEIAEVYAKYSIAQEEAKRIQEILAEAHGEVTLQSVIESEGRRAADNLLASQMDSLRQTRVDVEAQANQLKREIEELNKKAASIRSERLDEYSRYLRKNFLSLDVKSYSEAVFQTLTPSLFETGSTLPRALLAYQFAILLLISEHSPATVCPIIIDAPNQQGQDKEHLPQILKFISESQPPGTQLILGIENDTGVEFGGKTIYTPVEKYALLQSDQYESVHAEIFNMLKASLH
jgi:Fe2+ transport system protein B